MSFLYKEIPELLCLLPRELWLVIQKQLFTNNLNIIEDKLHYPTYRYFFMGPYGRIHVYVMRGKGYRFVRYAYPAWGPVDKTEYEPNFESYDDGKMFSIVI